MTKAIQILLAYAVIGTIGACLVNAGLLSKDGNAIAGTVVVACVSYLIIVRKSKTA